MSDTPTFIKAALAGVGIYTAGHLIGHSEEQTRLLHEINKSLNPTNYAKELGVLNSYGINATPFSEPFFNAWQLRSRLVLNLIKSPSVREYVDLAIQWQALEDRASKHNIYIHTLLPRSVSGDIIATPKILEDALLEAKQIVERAERNDT